MHIYRVLCTRCLIHVVDDRVENIHRKDAATEESNDSSTVDPETEGTTPLSMSRVHPCLGLIFSCLCHLTCSLSLSLPPLPISLSLSPHCLSLSPSPPTAYLSLPLPPLPLSLNAFFGRQYFAMCPTNHTDSSPIFLLGSSACTALSLGHPSSPHPANLRHLQSLMLFFLTRQNIVFRPIFSYWPSLHLHFRPLATYAIAFLNFTCSLASLVRPQDS